ncbi:MAG: GyrI-like domain-containing protein [Bacteroidota bacterium]
MNSRIETQTPTKLIGMRMEMSLVENKTRKLWQSFMPRRAEIKNRLTSDFISMQVYEDIPKLPLNPHTSFEKWATVEVAHFDDIPSGMEAYTIEGGNYAVFNHKGPASSAPQIMQYVFGEWLPNSKYELAHREHFERLPKDYDPNDPEAEEEIWIPIK